MKRILLLTLLALLMLSTGLADVSGQTATATVYFIRLNQYAGSANSMTILVDGQPVVLLRNRSVYRHELPAGEHTLTGRMGDESSLLLRAMPGAVYYVKCYLVPGFWSSLAQLELMDYDAGRAIVEGGSLTVQGYRPISADRPRSRLGLGFGAGGGLQDIHMGYTTDNQKLTLSSGGGVWIGGEYGYEIFRHLDIASDLTYHVSSLSPSINNGKASFSRISVGLTPSLVIPVKNDFLRFKLGAGPDLYLNGSMKMSGALTAGDKLVFRYYNTLGLHALLALDVNYTDRSSLALGVRPYYVAYENNPGRGNAVFTDPRVNSPNGSGIDLCISYYFRF